MKIRKLALGLLAVAGAVALVVGVSVGSARTAKKAAAFKAAWIYVGPHNDNGWSQAHDKGRLYAQKALGSNVETTYKENVPEGPQTSQVIESLIRDGNKIIFATSFGFQPAMVEAAKKHPDVKFEMATGTAQSKNMAEYFGAGEDAIYLSGMAAGAATRKGVIGYVVPFAIPEVIRHANAFALGAQATHPGAKVRLIWTNFWLDHAESKGVPWVGYDSDARKFAPKQWLTAAIYNWGPYYLRRTKAAMNGTWKTGFYYGTLKEGFVGLAPYGPKVSAKTKKAIAKKKQAMISGKFYEFTGPLYDQKGKLRVPKGKKLTVKDLYAMNWLVRGVIGSAKG
jgi:basic membrane protein A and related proteins